MGTDLRQASANSAGTLGTTAVESSTKLDICAHARSVWIGPEKVSVADGSTSSIDDRAGVWLGINSRLSDAAALWVTDCAAATASKGCKARNNFMAGKSQCNQMRPR
jgi:hypothetical protein